jgi:UDPglucose--hexose-1-phosphate uridylyltransferase
VPNLYPAFERQEVVVHSRRHTLSFAELAPEESALVAEAWRRRAAAAEAASFPYVHALINEGRAAGASLSHSHSQLVWLREEPPAIEAERRARCGVCSLLEGDENVVAAQDGIVALCPPAGRAPYELLLAPAAHDESFGGWLGGALALLALTIAALHAVEGPVPWNAWLHAGEHPHLEVVPRIGVFAGIELGAGIWVNVVPPEDAARELRRALAAEPLAVGTDTRRKRSPR